MTTPNVLLSIAQMQIAALAQTLEALADAVENDAPRDVAPVVADCKPIALKAMHAGPFESAAVMGKPHRERCTACGFFIE